MKDGSGPREIGNLLDAVMGRRGLGRQYRKAEDARNAWVGAAGDELSSHTRVQSLRQGVLTVEVDSSSLCHRLASFERDTLLHRVQERTRKVQVSDLRFRVGAFS